MATRTSTHSRRRTDTEAILNARNDHDLDGNLEHLPHHVEWTQPSTPEPLQDKEAVAADLRETFAGLPDLHLPVEDFHIFPSEDATVFTTWTLTATNTHALTGGGMELPATGRSIRFSGVTRCRFDGEKITEYAMHFDSLDVMQQLGLLPRTGGVGFKAVVMADLIAGKAGDLAGRAVKVVRR
jgi:predicted ester cyclase